MDDSYCINPVDERSYKLLNNIYDSLLPCFESKIFNVGCDEVGDLEVGKTKEECEKIGVENVYLNHILKLYDMLKSRDKRMMMWADVVFNHPACIEKLPKDLIPLIWGYEAETDFDSSCKKLRECGLEYYVCPGTASWASILGDNDKMRKNLYNAANGCIKYGGLGFLLTDWGDAGHGQFPIISYQSIAYGGGVTWCIKKNKELEDAQDYTDKYIFKSINKSFARILYKASRLIPKSGNTTDPFLSMLLPFENMDLISRIKEERLDEVEKELNKLVEQAQRVVMDNEDASLIIDEFRCNAEQFLILNELFRFKYEKRDTGKIKNLEQRLQKFEQRIKEAEVFYTKVWNKRNLETGSEAFWKYVRDGVKRVRDSEKKEETKLNK